MRIENQMIIDHGLFQWRNGWSFKRLDNGAVRIRHGSLVMEEALIPPAEWASIIAAVGGEGHNGESHHEALCFHMRTTKELIDGKASNSPYRHQSDCFSGRQDEGPRALHDEVSDDRALPQMAGTDSQEKAVDGRLWIEHPRSSLPMTARAYATCIMVDLKRAGISVPLHTPQGYTTQDMITSIIKKAMAKSAETYRETRWWKRLGRRFSGREWP